MSDKLMVTVYMDELTRLSTRVWQFRLFALALACGLSGFVSPAQAESNVQAADRELSAGHFKEACELYRAALSTDRQNVSVLLSAAKAYDGAGDLDEAIRRAREAVVFGKDNPMSHFALGCYLNKNRDERTAMMQFQEVLELKNVDPGLRKAAYGPILRLSKKLNEFPKMVKYAKDAAHEFSKDPDCHYNYGWALSQMPKTKPKEYAKYQKDAITEYQKSIELGVQRSDAHLKLATLFAEQEDKVSARSELAKYINLAPDAQTLPVVTALQQKLR